MTEIELSLVDMKVKVVSRDSLTTYEAINEAEKLLDKLIVKRFDMLNEITTKAKKFEE